MQTKSNFAKFIDNLTIISSFFLILILLFSKFISNRPILFFICLILSFITNKLFEKLITKLTKTKKLKKQEEKLANEIISVFKTASPTKLQNFWILALQKFFTIKKSSASSLIIQTNTSKIYFCYDFTADQTPLEKILQALDKAIKINAKLYFLSKDFTLSAKNFTNKNLFLFDTIGTYEICKKLNYFPQIKEEHKTKKSLKRFIQIITNKNLFKGYFKISVLFFMLSFILPFKTYYRIFAIITLTLTIICISKKSKSKVNLLPLFN